MSPPPPPSTPPPSTPPPSTPPPPGDLGEPASDGDPTPHHRAGRNLPAAVAVGLGLGGAVAATLLLYRPAFAALVAVAIAAGTWELVSAFRTAGIRPPLPPLLIGAVLMEGMAWLRGPQGLGVAFLLTILAVVIWRLPEGPEAYLRDTAAGVLVAMYVPLLAGFAVLLAHADDGASRVIAVVAVVVCNDTFGYATGVFLGRHPLAPSVSPKKSLEGFAGSVLACVVFGAAYFDLVLHNPWWHGALFGLALALTATLGDLGESMIKRDLGIKDMGSWLPGHGGLMDRLDSVLPSVAVGYLLLMTFVPPA